jgi:tryptophan-rich sensory protein
MSNWSVADGAALIAHTLFVFWQPMPMKEEEIAWYTENKSKLPWLARVPSGVFGLVWFGLYVGLIIGITVFSKNVTAAAWVWPTVYALYFANVFISKSWTWLFFTKKQFALSLVNAIVLALTAIAMVVCVGVAHDDIGDVYWVPLMSFIIYATWLCYAIFLNIAWMTTLELTDYKKPKDLLQEGMMKLTQDQLRMSRILGSAQVPVAFAGAETAKAK